MMTLQNLQPFVEELKTAIRQAQNQALQSVNKILIQLYWTIGQRIVEKQDQYGWGKSIVSQVSEELQKEFVGQNGFSERNLWNMRNFYVAYKDHPKLQTLSAEISWSHYIVLTHISNPSECSFYEIEATNNHWSLKELKRQFDTGLFERLQLSTQKDTVQQLATQGQIIESPSDLVKDPYILEFVGLPVLANYSESTSGGRYQ